MQRLNVSEAITLVRKNLEELDPNGSIMFDDENGSSSEYGDNASMNDIIKRNLPEAINAVNKVAPVNLLQGFAGLNIPNEDVTISIDGVLTFTIPASAAYLRLVAFKAADSRIVVTDVLPEASPEARKQLNPYIRGRADRPRLVLMQNNIENVLTFAYYSLTSPSAYEESTSAAIALFSFVQELFYASNATWYDCAQRLRQNVIDYLTAMVLEAYNDQRAQSYYQKASSFLSA